MPKYECSLTFDFVTDTNPNGNTKDRSKFYEELDAHLQKIIKEIDLANEISITQVSE